MHPAEKYAHDVRAGKVVVGKLVKLAVERYFNDLDTALDRGLVFNRKKAENGCRFFPDLLRHSKGKWRGQAFKLEPWQAFLIWNIFGWYNADGTRRFNTCLLMVARKNGKTPLAAGVGLKMMVADGVAGAEVYVCATKWKQAYDTTFVAAKNMVNKSPDLLDEIEVYTTNMHSEELLAKFEPLASGADTHDGLAPYCGVLEEYHAHPTAELYDIIEDGMGSWENPMIFIPTTAGYNKQGPCYRMRDLAIKILNGVLEQDNFFALIYELDEDDDWEDSTNWAKANPSMEAIDTLPAYLDKRYKGVKNDPSKLVSFLTKNLNDWTDSSEVWIEDKRWMQCDQAVSYDAMASRECYAALDLSSTTDITCLFLLFFDETGFDLLPYFFVPELSAKQRVKKDNVPYDLWIRQGYIEETPGDVIDYDYIRRRVSGYYVEDGTVKHDENCIADHVQIKRIEYDRWNSSQLVNDLVADGLEMSPFGQGFGSMSAPTKEFKKIVLKAQVRHGGNPVLRWMISNVEIKKDAAGNEKIDKAASSEKVDGPVAGVMALGGYLTDADQYDDDMFDVKTV